MAAQKKSPYGKKRRLWRYFYYGGKLHKTITVDRGADEVYAWCYSEKKRYIYSWSEVQRVGQPGITTAQAAKIVNRSVRSIYVYMQWGYIRRPERTVSFETGGLGPYILSRDDVEDLHNVVKSIHFGRPRDDGAVTQRNVPNDKEVRAASVHRLFLYAKKEDENDETSFVPVWDSEEW